ncbi:MAG: TerC/Alx family metal homeostasis membrane protein [Steroidobacteraceae bacterium]
MPDILLFPFAQYWWVYAAFVVLIGALLALDLGVIGRESHEVTMREAAIRSGAFVLLALAFNAALYYYMLWSLPARPELGGMDHALLARNTALEFLAGYVVEYALAIDNVFVFVAVFGYFAVPAAYQQKVLFYGILGAIAFRAIFISLGSILMQYHWVVVVFGVFLLATGVKILFLPEKPIDPERNPVLRVVRRLWSVTPQYHGDRFWVEIDGRQWVTPLFVALAFIEFSDIIFAIDSVPAIFALTNEPLIVFTSNILAIMGLRSLFFVLQGMVQAFQFLKYGLGVILVFVGLKMVWLNEAFGGKFPISWSLGIIGAILALSILVSVGYQRTRRLPADPAER